MGVLCHNPLQAPRYQSDLMLQKVRLLSWYVATTSSLNGRDMGSWMGGRTGLMPSSHGHRAGLTVSLLESPLNNHKKKIRQVEIGRSGLFCYLKMLVLCKTLNFAVDPVGREVASREDPKRRMRGKISLSNWLPTCSIQIQ